MVRRDGIPPDLPGEDGTNLLVSSFIGVRGHLTRRQARNAAEVRRLHVKGYPRAEFAFSIAGYEEDHAISGRFPKPRVMCGTGAHLCGIMDATRHFSEPLEGLPAIRFAHGRDAQQGIATEVISADREQHNRQMIDLWSDTCEECLVVPHNALFPSYKASRVHHAARRRCGARYRSVPGT
jgi:hypothetical protein